MLQCKANFNEDIYRRCDEITSNDSKYQNYLLMLFELHNSLMNIMTPQQIKLFVQFCNCISDFQSYAEALLYQHGISEYNKAI